MKPGSKYYPLFEHLQGCDQEGVTLTFAKIEALMGDSLPDSAPLARAWGQAFPEELLPLRLFKCRMWLWLVVPGLYDEDPQQLRGKEE